MFLKLRYTDTDSITLGSAINTTAIAVWSGNSIYDPFVGVGHQPYGMDQWTQFYGRYRVYGSKIRAEAYLEQVRDDQSNYNGFQFGVVPNASAVVDATVLNEMPRCRWRWSTAFYSKHPRISHYASTAQIYGVSKQTASTNAEFSASTTSDPAAPWFWYVWMRKLDDTAGATADLPLKYRVTITYYVVLYDRKWLTRS